MSHSFNAHKDNLDQKNVERAFDGAPQNAYTRRNDQKTAPLGPAGRRMKPTSSSWCGSADENIGHK